jgi:hypothetical protein
VGRILCGRRYCDLLAYEIYDIVDNVTAIRVGTFIINVAAIVYLLWTKRLFGIRGGYAAYEAHRHEESIARGAGSRRWI